MTPSLHWQSFAFPLSELAVVDAAEADAVADLEGEIAVGNVDEGEGGAAEEMPAAGAGEGVDAGLPAGEADAARFDAEARAGEPRDAAQFVRQIAQVGKPRHEADRVDDVFGGGVQLDDAFGGQAGEFGHAGQVEVELVADGDFVAAGFGRCRPAPGGVLLEPGDRVRGADLVGVEEDADAGVGGHHVLQPRGRGGAHRGGETHSGGFVRQVGDHGFFAERHAGHRGCSPILIPWYAALAGGKLAFTGPARDGIGPGIGRVRRGSGPPTPWGNSMIRTAAGGLAVALSAVALVAADVAPVRSKGPKSDDKPAEKAPTPLRPAIIIAPLAADVLADAVKDEQNACTRRLDVCAKLRELAAAKNDETLLARIDELEKQAVEICQARVARMGIRGSAARPTRDPAPSTAIDPASIVAPAPAAGGSK